MDDDTLNTIHNPSLNPQTTLNLDIVSEHITHYDIRMVQAYLRKMGDTTHKTRFIKSNDLWDWIFKEFENMKWSHNEEYMALYIDFINSLCTIHKTIVMQIESEGRTLDDNGFPYRNDPLLVDWWYIVQMILYLSQTEIQLGLYLNHITLTYADIIHLQKLTKKYDVVCTIRNSNLVEVWLYLFANLWGKQWSKRRKIKSQITSLKRVLYRLHKIIITKIEHENRELYFGIPKPDDPYSDDWHYINHLSCILSSINISIKEHDQDESCSKGDNEQGGTNN